MNNNCGVFSILRTVMSKKGTLMVKLSIATKFMYNLGGCENITITAVPIRNKVQYFFMFYMIGNEVIVNIIIKNMVGEKMKKILIVNSKEVICDGLKNLLKEKSNFVVDYTICSKQVLEQIKRIEYDLYLIDLEIGKKFRTELIVEIKCLQPNAKIIIPIPNDQSNAFNYFMDMGVFGFIDFTSNTDIFIKTIQYALDGYAIIPQDLFKQLRKTRKNIILDNNKEISLSSIEEEILLYISKGKTNKRIAEKTYMSQRNVERYLTSIYRKFNVHSRTEAVKLAMKLELIPKFIISH